jgi:hypothetical protein
VSKDDSDTASKVGSDTVSKDDSDTESKDDSDTQEAPEILRLSVTVSDIENKMR